MKTQGPFHVVSAAKITLHLRILARRSDGFHAVRIALVPVSLFDRITFAFDAAGAAPGVRLAVQGKEPLGAEADNLVLRAARAYEQALGAPLAVTIGLQKHIPAGAGLGGGSGNAAATLVALNRWHGQPVGPARLHALAQGLGADVPFFLDCRPAWAEGIGEQLSPLGPLPPLELLVVKPPLAVSTAAAYGAVRTEAEGGPAPAAGLDTTSVERVARSLFNGFEAALLPQHPELGALKAALLEAGARGALLSGSGSAVFGVFAGAAARDAAAARLANRAATEGWRLLPCRTLPGHRYDFMF